MVTSVEPSQDPGIVAHTATMNTEFIALRTVAVYLKSGQNTVKVNALLDDASSKTFINSDIAAQLGLEGMSEELTVNVLNNNQTQLESSVVDFTITSTDGKTS